MIKCEWNSRYFYNILNLSEPASSTRLLISVAPSDSEKPSPFPSLPSLPSSIPRIIRRDGKTDRRNRFGSVLVFDLLFPGGQISLHPPPLNIYYIRSTLISHTHVIQVGFKWSNNARIARYIYLSLWHNKCGLQDTTCKGTLEMHRLLEEELNRVLLSDENTRLTKS